MILSEKRLGNIEDNSFRKLDWVVRFQASVENFAGDNNAVALVPWW